MSEPLTREQVEQLCERIRTWKYEINYILETDAALREQLATMTAERDEAVRVARDLAECGVANQRDIDWATSALNLCRKEGEAMSQPLKTSTHCHLNYGGYDYDIEWSRLDTPLKLVGWVHHLTGKRWMNNRTTKEFIECVCEYHEWDCETL